MTTRYMATGAAKPSVSYTTKAGLAVAGIATGAAMVHFGAEAKTGVDVGKVKEAIIEVYETNNDLGPFFVRLAWHASGTYSKHSKDGGSGGGATMRFSPEIKHGANAGLSEAQALLEPVKAKFPELSYADLWTLAAVTVIEEMGGPAIKWQQGRKDAESGKQCTPDGRLPDGDSGTPESNIKHIRAIFYRMGFNDREIVALAGAHALGRCHKDRSGFEGPWTRAPTTFSNEYFRLLLEDKWTLRQWDGPSQWENEAGDLMMLHADMAFIWDKDFKKYVEMYAADEELFFKDFSAAFQKLEELGCTFDKAAAKPWYQFW